MAHGVNPAVKGVESAGPHALRHRWSRQTSGFELPIAAKGADDRYVCEDWLFLAMANWKLERKGEARQWYDRAAEWMAKKEPAKELDIHHFRSEAVALIGIEKKE